MATHDPGNNSRTSVSLPPAELKRWMRLAKAIGMPFSRMVRCSLLWYISRKEEA